MKKYHVKRRGLWLTLKGWSANDSDAIVVEGVNRTEAMMRLQGAYPYQANWANGSGLYEVVTP